MTHNRSLKRQVRERMARTGEKYTVARRAVIDQWYSGDPHEPHTHIVDGQVCVARPCPDCTHCRCPQHSESDEE